jgi:hypothetical protein
MPQQHVGLLGPWFLLKVLLAAFWHMLQNPVFQQP